MLRLGCHWQDSPEQRAYLPSLMKNTKSVFWKHTVSCVWLTFVVLMQQSRAKISKGDGNGHGFRLGERFRIAPAPEADL
jgi:hypothetical protein